MLYLIRHKTILISSLPALFLFLVLLSCGRKANPVIPVKVLPKGVDNLSAQVKGRALIVFWTIPTRNTDESPLTDLKEFKLLKGQWPTKDFCPSCPDQFQETRLIQLHGPRLPDVTVETNRVEVVFSKLQPGQTYSFQVTALTKNETASGPSRTLRVAWDLPLQPPSKLEAKLQGEGVHLSWEAPQNLVDGASATGLSGYALYRRTGKDPWTKVTAEPIKGTSYLDKDLRESEKYVYQVRALRRVGSSFLESEGSNDVSLVYVYKGPPPVIRELVGIPDGRGIDLRWQSLENSRSSGYHIYKRSENESESKRITAERITETTFHDGSVVQGIRYFYSVTVVGAPPDLLEGPKSKEIEITYMP